MFLKAFSELLENRFQKVLFYDLNTYMDCRTVDLRFYLNW
ncbi:MAG: hypothetical protein ACI8QW_001609 [Saprospiraceae bacterium]|jgi:hypothetical protein